VSVDPYVDLTTGVLLNKLGIGDPNKLREVEADITAAVIIRLLGKPLPGRFDLRHLQRLHLEIFGPLYPWAGQIRTVAIAKTDLFCLPHHIEPYARSVFDELANEKLLRGLGRDEFLDRVTHYFAEVNAIHPFREGNGRTQRAFFGQLAREAGWPIDWSNLDAQVNTDASVAALRGNNSILRDMLDRFVAP